MYCSDLNEMHRLMLICFTVLLEVVVFSNAVHITDRLESVIRNKCIIETIREEILDEFHQLVHCWPLPLSEKDATSQERYDQCIDDSRNLTACLQEFAEKLTPCLHEKERYMPQFIVNSYGNYNHHLCKFVSAKGDTMERIKKCQKVFDDDPLVHPLAACFLSSNLFNSKSEDGIMTKEELCGDLKTVRDCYEKILNEHCSASPEMKNIQIAPIVQAVKQCEV